MVTNICLFISLFPQSKLGKVIVQISKTKIKIKPIESGTATENKNCCRHLRAALAAVGATNKLDVAAAVLVAAAVPALKRLQNEKKDVMERMQ